LPDQNLPRADHEKAAHAHHGQPDDGDPPGLVRIAEAEVNAGASSPAAAESAILGTPTPQSYFAPGRPGVFGAELAAFPWAGMFGKNKKSLRPKPPKGTPGPQ